MSAETPMPDASYNRGNRGNRGNRANQASATDTASDCDAEAIERLGERIAALLDRIDALPDQAQRGLVYELLQQLDALHRPALQRLVAQLEHSDAGLIRAAADPAVHAVLALYDLLPDALPPPDRSRPPEAVIPLTPVQAPRLPLRPSAASAPAEPPPLPADLAYERERLRAPVLVPVVPLAALAEASMRGIEVDGARLLLCRSGGEVTAFRNRCPGSLLPLDLGTLEGGVIVCPWHGCRFDARSGRRLDAEGRLEPLPVSLQAGEVRVAVAVAELRGQEPR